MQQPAVSPSPGDLIRTAKAKLDQIEQGLPTSTGGMATITNVDARVQRDYREALGAVQELGSWCGYPTSTDEGAFDRR